ncbi:UDP-glucose 6-dehydrogenase [Iodidimonas gelatinilytica]|uniref:UDP-glucose 6-dehydrogenase n=1 Tax=Iodidimonas gelatinilytica TaxID=1236966 RepID=A0A5A7MS60_9PROT|nr:UDP-glucose/GDP-mannose dehydrogenase family protein [Iodidimonas gelatinilytica]GEQ98832.1 UDP-glucose 6-dehydrogenase [Iodidimonas gelatinilytica]GER01366.1 UDP-glucose 6-dehydrogenase [Iodidimonas gelatinilytica]
MRVTIVGTGYVGLVSGACFSEFGHHVTCVDVNDEKIKALKAGDIPIFEPGLDSLVDRNVKAGRLDFSTRLADSVGASDAVFIAVGTPSRRGDGHADLSYVMKAAEEVASLLYGYTVVVTKSTVPVGTGAKIEEILMEHAPDKEWDVASNPEFLREGAAITDFMHPDRVVVGTTSERARNVMKELYRPLFLNETPVMFTRRESAELIKYAANAFLATKISFINEMADLCEQLGADVQDVAKGIGLDNRIGKKFLHAGPGYGGSCFPKDTLALLRTAQQVGTPLRIVQATVDANDNRKRAMADRIIAALGGSAKGKRVAMLGLTFKPNTDDMRDSPSLDIVPALLKAGATIHAYDPEGTAEAKKLLPDITYCDDAYACMNGADILVIVTEWNQFRALDFDRAGDLLKNRILVDLRNIYARGEPQAKGFEYYGIGRGGAASSIAAASLTATDS